MSGLRTHKKQIKTSGAFLVLVLVLGAVFFAVTSASVGYIVTQSQVVQQRYLLDRSSDIAEAGLNYYKWYLAHFPGDVTNGTGLPGPYVHAYEDPEDGAIGEFSLSIASSTYCGDIASIEVTSTGYTYEDPTLIRTITARYAQPTVAEYAFIINSNVWAGSDRTIVGPYHSNQGIRMDGTNQSTVTSGLTDWSCTSSFGCSPTQTVDGVFTSTANANPALFYFPSAPINFTDLTIDLANMKDRAQNNGGVYIPYSGNYGYHVVFNGDGTVTASPVTGTYEYWGYSSDDGWVRERNIISSTGGGTTYAISDDCPLVYVEDKIWLEGVVDQRVSIAADGTDINGDDPNIILQGDITYVDTDEDGLLAIAEDNVLLGIDVPDDMTVNGIFIAQDGRYGRNYYTYGYLPNPSGPLNFKPYYERNSLTANGTIVSNGRVGTKWTSGGTFVSGFQNRTNTYDRNLVDNPPPLVPNTSDVYEFTEWREED
tara:strand:- start:4327 stop:5775 length:1449 start_codon:yes stop_codon:yes gene_type:complete